MVDFTNCQVKPYKIYGGANGGKLGIVYNGIDYMLKFPSQKKGEMSGYANSCISEYISCRIIETLGLNVQETILGSYIKNGANNIVIILIKVISILKLYWWMMVLQTIVGKFVMNLPQKIVE